jgi:hypothetical protein
MKPSVVRPCSGSIVGKKQSCSSVWLEHYTDNVGVSSSNLLGTTKAMSEGWDGGMSEYSRIHSFKIHTLI